MKKIALFLLLSSTLLIAKEASFLSVLVDYFHEDKKVFLNASNESDERVTLYVSLLDESGEFATKGAYGASLGDITVDDITSLAEANITEEEVQDSEADDKKIARFVLDYSDVSTDKRSDTVTLNIGEIRKEVTIEFDYVRANGLVLRVATKTIDPQKMQGFYFTDIVPDGDNNLSVQSDTYYGGVAGSVVPLKIYASTAVQDDDAQDGALVQGRFTISSELNNEIVVVHALADYSVEGNASVVIASAEGRMQNGLAQIDMTITHALPDDKDNLHALFDKKKFDGLGVAFIAYMKNDLSISNKGILQHSDLSDPSKFYVRGDHNATDTVTIKSDDAYNIKIGEFDRMAPTLDRQWSKPYVNYYVLDDNLSSTEQNISLTIVDRFGNPAEETKPAKTTCEYSVQDYFDIDCNNGFREDGYSIGAKKIMIAPKTSKLAPSDIDYYSQVNPFVQESKNISLDMKIIGADGLASAQTLDVNLYLARVTTNHLATKGFSNTFSESNITLTSNNTIRDYKVVVTQKESNSSFFNVEIYDRHIEGDYDDDDLYTSFTKTINGTALTSSDINYSDLLGGVSLNITGVGSIGFPASFAYSSRFPLDGFTAYFFAVQSGLDNHIVILTRDYTDSNLTRSVVEPGGELAFYLYGLASSNDDFIEVQYGVDGLRSQIGLTRQSAITSQPQIFNNKVGDFVSKSDGLVVRGYTVLPPSDAINAFQIWVNGHTVNTTANTTGRGKVVSSSSDLIIDDSPKYGLWPEIEFEYKNENDNANTKQVAIKEFGATNNSTEDGSSKNDLLALKDINGDKIDDATAYFEPTTSEVVYRGRVYANKYYLLFDSDSDLEEQDAFGNVLLTDDGSSRALQRYKYSISGGGEVDDNSADDIYVRFNSSDVGSQRRVSIQADDGVNTILFTNILGSTFENNEYIIVAQDAKSNTILVNTEALVIVKGNNQATSDEFFLTFTHSNKEATTYVKLLSETRIYESSYENKIYGSLDKEGNSYLFRTDLAGEVTITARGEEENIDEDKVVITGTTTLRVINEDNDAPVVDIQTRDNDIIVTIDDDSLDFARTIVEARNDDGIVIKKSTRKDNVYTISSLPQGTFQVYVYAIDLFDNTESKTFLRTITEELFDNSIKYSLEAKLLAQILLSKGDYSTYGKFTSYAFGSNEVVNWIYQDAITDKTYKVFANQAQYEEQPFGLEEFTPDFTKIGAKKWFLVQLLGETSDFDAKGRFGWVLISDDLQIVKKILQLNEDGSLLYAPLPLKARLENESLSFY